MTDNFQSLRNTTHPLTAARTGRPHQGPTNLDHITSEVRLDTEAFTDGTTTEVLIIDPEDATSYLGRGVARRRKGDPRNIVVGHQVALARALRDMADALEAELLR